MITNIELSQNLSKMLCNIIKNITDTDTDLDDEDRKEIETEIKEFEKELSNEILIKTGDCDFKKISKIKDEKVQELFNVVIPALIKTLKNY